MRYFVAYMAVLLVCSANALAQPGAMLSHEVLINRLGGQSTMIAPSEKPTEGSPVFSLNFPETRIFTPGGGIATIKGYIINHTDSAVNFGFYRTHLRKPFNWSSSICMGLCFLDTKDSMPAGFSFSVEPGASSEVEVQLQVPSSPLPDSIVDYIKYVALTGNSADTISIIVSGFFATAGVESNNAVSSKAKIISLYPSPLIDGNSIKVKVASPKEQSFTYSISDELGRSVAFGTTHQRLMLGDNTCQIGELAGLSNGMYLLKFTFADGSMDTRSFQVAH